MDSNQIAEVLRTHGALEDVGICAHAADLIEQQAAALKTAEELIARKDVTITTISNALTYAEQQGSMYRVRCGELENENRRVKIDLTDAERCVDLLQDQANRDAATIIRLRGEVSHWKGNHADIVKRKALLEQRPDLPVDRIPAMREMESLQNRLAEAEQRNALQQAVIEAMRK